MTILFRNNEQLVAAMDRFDMLRVFVRVAEARSFSKAAIQLSLPRSTVSTAVQMLESRLGQPLLHRTTRAVSLTTDGEAFLDRCIRLLADLEETENLFKQEGPPSGLLRVTVPSRIGHVTLAPILPDFLERNPGLTIELRSTDRRQDLIEDGIDCAVRVGETDDEQLISHALGKLTIVNCASPGYLEKFGTPQQPADLDRHNAVGFIPGSSRVPEPWTYVHGGQTRSVTLASVLTTDDVDTYIAAGLAGLGLIQVPSYDVQTHLARKQLVEILPDARAEAMPVSLVYPQRRHLSQRLRVFVKWAAPILSSKLVLAT